MLRYLMILLVALLTACPDNPTDPPPCRGPDDDEDGVLESCDNCPDVENEDQSDIDFDGAGDACDDDRDNDFILNDDDLCPDILDELNADADSDGIGDVCDRCPNGDNDADGDGVFDCLDTCPIDADPTNEDSDGDGVGDVCDVCPNVPDKHQNTTNGEGDACTKHPFTIQELTIKRLHDALEEGSLSCEEVTEMFLDHIVAYDLNVTSDPPRNAFVSFNVDLREQAKTLDDIQADDGLLPLHCVPFVVKTNFEAPEIETTGGTAALMGTKSPTNSPSVQRLRDAGALLIASTSMDELARGVDGIGSRTGKTGNAYDPSLHSGGSSAGSGVSVGSNFAMFGLGTDNCASLLMPSNLNGLTSIRSTHLLIEMDGMFPSGLSDGVAGPMARTVEDLARVMDYMVAPERPNTVTRPFWDRPDSYTDHLLENGLEGKRIGVLRKLGNNTSDGYARPFETSSGQTHLAWQELFEVIEREGGVLVENVQLPEFDENRSGGGFTVEMDKWFNRVDSPVNDFAGMCDSEKYSAFVWSDSADCRASMVAGRAGTGVENALATRRRYYKNAAYVEDIMDTLELDVLLYPTTPYGEANASGGRVNCVLGSTTGMPSMTVITTRDRVNELPFGVTITGRNFDERRVFEVAYALERATNARTKPTFASPPQTTAMDLGAENDLRTAIGEASSTFFRSNGKRAMTTTKMRDLTIDILEDAGRTELTP